MDKIGWKTLLDDKEKMCRVIMGLNRKGFSFFEYYDYISGRFFAAYRREKLSGKSET